METNWSFTFSVLFLTNEYRVSYMVVKITSTNSDNISCIAACIFPVCVCVCVCMHVCPLTSELVYVGSEVSSSRYRDKPKSDTLHTRLLFTKMFRAARSR